MAELSDVVSWFDLGLSLEAPIHELQIITTGTLRDAAQKCCPGGGTTQRTGSGQPLFVPSQLQDTESWHARLL